MLLGDMGAGVEILNSPEKQGLGERLLKGEVFLLRHGLQRFGIYDTLVESTLQGIRVVLSEDARKVYQCGFQRVHEFLRPKDIPTVTDAICDAVTANAKVVLRELVPGIFPDSPNYYFERHPNVRFHIPYDLAVEQRKEFEKFAKKHGEGKITAHGPHRDPWVDCPDNAINLWIAMGPVRHGNGMGIFINEYHNEFKFKEGYLQTRKKLHPPITVEMEPGDILLFHGKHLHASELNQTNETRYVISYRITLNKPHYLFGHYHHYVHGRLASGGFGRLAEVPQNLQWSFVRYQFQRIKYKLTGKGRMSGQDSDQAETGVVPESPMPNLSEVPIGEIRAISKTKCATRLNDNEVVTFTRYCPHAGGDFAQGWIQNGQIMCPLHLMTFDLRTG
ncbi:MAG: phytanoyl-CoA dioxygenase family protein, partial [Anaerolineae bacterium]|nr:phytanoyl-CoA dioxygenase family protein [Anaerolineae bacterium]